MEKNIQEQQKSTFKDFFLRNLSSLKNMITKNNSTNEIEIDKSLFIIEETNIANDKTKSEEQDIEETPDYEDENPKLRYKKLQNDITGVQLTELIEKDRRKDQELDLNRKLNYYISCVPVKLRTNDLITELHKKYDNTELSNELAYALIINELEINEINAIKAMNHFSELKFITEYDPIGADNSWGQLCGCDYYVNSSMKNPAEVFHYDMLTIEQWHNLVKKDTRLLEYIPKETISNETFWHNYVDFIGKGKYLNHPENEWKEGMFDEYEVFDKMPQKLKDDVQVVTDLLKRGAVSINFVKNPTEEIYLMVSPENYRDIPAELREKESFRKIAVAAFDKDVYQIQNIPEKFITKEMASTALSFDMQLALRVPEHLLTEDMLVEKINNYSQQGYFKTKSIEHPSYVEFEREEHTKVLQYIPIKLRTERVCREAIKVNPQNLVFVPNELKDILNTQSNNTTSKKEATKEATILKELEKLNISTNEIKKEFQNLLTTGKTFDLVTIPISKGKINIDFKARLSTKIDEAGNTHLFVHPKRDLETELSKGFQGHVFSDEEKGNLMALGSAGKAIPIKKEDGTLTNYLIGIDSLTNELIAIPQKEIVIKDEFGGIKLTEKKKEALSNGQPVFMEGIKKGNIKCSSLVQYNVEKGRLEILQYGINITSFQNVKLQKEQQELLKEGKTVLISGLFDGQGVKYNAWVRLDMKNMKLIKSKDLPNKKMDSRKEIIPSTEYRVQVSQNTKGLKNEVNKFTSTPVLSGNQKASDNSDQKKNKGHKM